MTKHRAEKKAARERAAATGERYVVAKRSLNESPPNNSSAEHEQPYRWIVRVLHDLTHRVPGVPPHADPASIRADHEARAASVRRRHATHAAAARARARSVARANHRAT
jgi:hypothetical protein